MDQMNGMTRSWLSDDANILRVLEYFVCIHGFDLASLQSIKLTCKRFYDIASTGRLWISVPIVFTDGSLNLHSLIMLGVSRRDTDVTYYNTISRGNPTLRFSLKDTDISSSPQDHQPFGVSQNFIREVSLLRRLSHPNIHALLGTRFTVDRIYLMYPYVRMSVGDLLRHRLPIHRSNGVCILLQVLCGLSHCHSRGVLHRNLTPMNVLVDPRQINEQIFMHIRALTEKDLNTYLRGATFKLTDFSKCRKILKSENCRFSTKDQFSFNLQYLPPEVLMGQCFSDSPADVWGVGCIFAEILTGCPLFNGRNNIDQLFRIFSKLGTPDSSHIWPDFDHLPYYREGLFPCWERLVPRGLSVYFPTATDADLEVMYQLLQLDPKKRVSAIEAIVFLEHNQIRRMSCSNPQIISEMDSLTVAEEETAFQSLFILHETRIKESLSPIMHILPDKSLHRYAKTSTLRMQQWVIIKSIECKKTTCLMDMKSHDLVLPSPYHINRCGSTGRRIRSMGMIQSIQFKLRSNVGYLEAVMQLINIYNVQLHDIVSLSTLFFTVSLLIQCMDIFILSQQVDCDGDDYIQPDIPSNIKVLSLGCLLVATKFEEEQNVGEEGDDDYYHFDVVESRAITIIRDFYRKLTNEQDMRHLLIMEYNILKITWLDMDQPTMLDYLEFLLEECDRIAPIHFIAGALAMKHNSFSILQFVSHFFAICTLVSTDARFLKHSMSVQSASIIYYSYAVIIANVPTVMLTTEQYESLLVAVVRVLKCWMGDDHSLVDLLTVGGCLYELRDDHWSRDLLCLYRPVHGHLSELQLLDTCLLDRCCVDKVLQDMMILSQ